MSWLVLFWAAVSRAFSAGDMEPSFMSLACSLSTCASSRCSSAFSRVVIEPFCRPFSMRCSWLTSRCVVLAALVCAEAPKLAPKAAVAISAVTRRLRFMVWLLWCVCVRSRTGSCRSYRFNEAGDGTS